MRICSTGDTRAGTDLDPPTGSGAHGSPRPFHFPPDLDAIAAFEEIRRLASPVAGSWAYSSAELEAPDRLAATGT
jgi:hypothetical protein